MLGSLNRLVFETIYCSFLVDKCQGLTAANTFPEDYDGTHTFPSFLSPLPPSCVMADSPRSDDSGMADSPVLPFDVAAAGSPFSSEKEFFPSGGENLPVADSPGLPFQSRGVPIPASSPYPHSPSPVTQTKGVDEKTIQKLLEVLVSCKTSAERSMISTVLTNILGGSIKKGPIVRTLLPKAKEGSGEHSVQERRKRPSNTNMCEITPKGPKIDDLNCGQGSPSIVILEQPEKVWCSTVITNKNYGCCAFQSFSFTKNQMCVGNHGNFWLDTCCFISWNYYLKCIFSEYVPEQHLNLTNLNLK